MLVCRRSTSFLCNALPWLYLTQWDVDLDLNHGQPHCVDYFSFCDCFIVSSTHRACVWVKRLTTIVKYKLNRETFVVWAASWALSQGKSSFFYLEANSNPVASKEFRKIFLRDQTKTFVDIIPFIPFLSTMTVASIWIWKELKTSRTNIVQSRFYQSLHQDCEPPSMSDILK